jgi:hypothetical protein
MSLHHVFLQVSLRFARIQSLAMHYPGVCANKANPGHRAACLFNLILLPLFRLVASARTESESPLAIRCIVRHSLRARRLGYSTISRVLY